MTSEPKSVVVQKFGGSSVADPLKLGQVADRVAATARAGKQIVVVVSAMGKTTDQLIALARSISASPPRRELDMLLSTGERISMALLAMALEARGLDAISFTGSQSGILTNDRHSGARIIEVRPVRIEDELARGKVVIVAGFQGMSYRREITTLGRGGSDTTAVALAAALGADCEIYSDVDGVYSADPRVVAEARHLPEIDYDAMEELALHGAKVLNAQAVAWARQAGVVIHARATAGSDLQTRVVAVGPGAAPARVVTGAARVVRVRAEGREPLAALLAQLSAREIELRALASSGGVAEARFSVADVPEWQRVEAELRAAGLHVSESGEVTLVGTGVGADARLHAAALARLRDGNIDVHDFDASARRISWRVAPIVVDDATRLIHDAFCRG